MKRKPEVPLSIRLDADQREVLTMYAKAIGKPMAHIVHEFIKENMVHMLLYVNRHEAEEEAKAPGASDWTPDLPNAKRDFEARERKAAEAQK